MSDFFKLLTEEDAPEAREITFRGETGIVYFRKMSAGQKEKFLEHITIKHTEGDGTPYDLNLGENERQRQMLVMYSVCDETGKRLFLNLDAVKKIPAMKLEVLAEHASEVNKRGAEDAGKA